MNIILTGNPNSGKTSLFNALTGLNHKVGNFPGVTIDRKIAQLTLPNTEKANIIDIPGTYSLYPKSQDEKVAFDALFNKTDEKADVVVIVVDASNLKRSLFLTTQIIELNIPCVIALTMLDVAEKKGITINIDALQHELRTPIVSINPRNNLGLDVLLESITNYKKIDTNHYQSFYVINEDYKQFIEEAAHNYQISDENNGVYYKLHQIHQLQLNSHSKSVQSINKKNISLTKIQSDEVIERYKAIENLLNNTSNQKKQHPTQALQSISLSQKIDKYLLHPIWGVVILFLVLFTVFQFVYLIASYPMDWIDENFSLLGNWVATQLPETWWSDLIVNGIIAGLGGVVIFVPQIAILFFLITILEDTGYMARISFIMDRLFQQAGLTGKSVMPMMSGMACAIPAVMAARIIENPKQRLITMLVTPFMSCTARLPVYAMLIALVVPEDYYFGIIGLQGLVLMAMYLLGFVTALFAARILNYFIQRNDKSIFIQELPTYLNPRWKNAFISMIDKSKTFLLDAGKIILIISVALWFLSSYGPSAPRNAIEENYNNLAIQQNGELTPDQITEKNALLLEKSYAGIFGKTIEPAIEPLGYDWKIGIALLSSFAAREVFVGTMGTIYSIEGADEDDGPLREKLQLATREDGSKVYTFATGMSLMVFYAFAMQCMATVATVKRETGGWKWALIQMVSMTGFAYICALITYQLLK